MTLPTSLNPPETDWSHAFKPDVWPYEPRKQVNSGKRTCTRHAGSASASLTLRKVHEHPDKVWSLWQSDLVTGDFRKAKPTRLAWCSRYAPLVACTTNGALWLLLSKIANKDLNTAYSYQLERHLFFRSLDQPQWLPSFQYQSRA